MPKRKYYDYGGKGKKSDYGYVPKSKNVSTQTEVKKLKDQVKSIKNAYEKKQFITTITSSMVSTVSVQMVSNIDQGSSSSTREGNKIKAYSINLSGSCELQADKNPSLGRIVLLIDHDNQGIIPAVTDIWADAGSFVTGLPRDRASGSNAAYKRFTILWDYKFDMNPSGSAGGVKADDTLISNILGSIKTLSSYYNRIFHYLTYSGSGTTITSQRQGSLFVMSGANATGRLLLAMKCVFKYTDN